MSSAVQAWIAAGKLAPESILDRLTPTDYLEAITSRMPELTSGSDNPDRLTESAFISRLTENNSLFKSSNGNEAGHIMYSALRYLASYPFPSLASNNDALTPPQLARAVGWLLPARLGGDLFVAGNSTRTRSKADHRRTIFQSFAVREVEVVSGIDADSWDREARDSATDGIDDFWLEYASCNRDEDGDQLYHDLLDVLFSSQPLRRPPYGDIHRDEFRGIAKQLHTFDLQLHDLVVSKRRLTALFKILLAAQWDQDDYSIDGGIALQEEHSNAAERIVSSYVPQGASGVNWLTFDHVLKNSTPRIFDPLYRILAEVLLGKLTFDLVGEVESYEIPKTSHLGSVSAFDQLGAALSAQMITYLSHSKTLSAQDAPVSESVPLAPSATAEDLFLLISGTAETGSEQLFAIFSSPSSDEGSAKLKLIRLLPEHKVQMLRGPVVSNHGYLQVGDQLHEPAFIRLSGGLDSGLATFRDDTDVRGCVLKEPRNTILKVQMAELWIEES